MNKLAMLLSATILMVSAPAQAAVMDSVNETAGPYIAGFAVDNLGWFYTPTFSYSLTGISTKFQTTDARTVTANFWSGSPGSLTLLGSGGFSPVENVFTDASFAPVSLTGGTTYFFSFYNIAGLASNVTADVGATSLAGGAFGGIGGGPTNFADAGPGFGPESQPIVRFLGERTAVPEPATWAMMLLGFGAIGAAMRTRRQQVTVHFAR